MKLISAVQGSGGGSGDAGGVVGGGQQQILISVPTSQHLGNIRAGREGKLGCLLHRYLPKTVSYSLALKH